MDATSVAIEGSIWFLAGMLLFLAVRGYRDFLEHNVRVQAMWASGLAIAAAAMIVEAVVFWGTVTEQLLQGYLFLSAALVGVLSLGATRVFRNARLELGYTAYTLGACAVAAVGCFLIHVPTGVVSQGVIGNPNVPVPLGITLVSSLVTIPATVVLLSSAAISLKRSRRWQNLLMIAGALVLGTGGFLWVVAFPVALYYAEFIGIVLLFIGIVNLRKLAAAAPAGAHATA